MYAKGGKFPVISVSNLRFAVSITIRYLRTDEQGEMKIVTRQYRSSVENRRASFLSKMKLMFALICESSNEALITNNARRVAVARDVNRNLSRRFPIVFVPSSRRRDVNRTARRKRKGEANRLEFTSRGKLG